MAVDDDDELFAAFLAGFRVSAEGRNGEHPGDVRDDELYDDFASWRGQQLYDRWQVSRRGPGGGVGG